MTTFFIMGLFPIGSYLEYYLLKKNFHNNKTIDNFDALLVLGGDERRSKINYCWRFSSFN